MVCGGVQVSSAFAGPLYASTHLSAESATQESDRYQRIGCLPAAFAYDRSAAANQSAFSSLTMGGFVATNTTPTARFDQRVQSLVYGASQDLYLC
jgi:hypothetical protein